MNARRLVCTVGFILGTIAVILGLCTLDPFLGFTGGGLMLCTVGEVMAS